MQLPHFELNSNINQLDSQDETLLAAGAAIPGDLNPGDIVGGTYEIIALIGSGGMGHVYQVRHTLMQQEYALKTLSAEQVNDLAWRRFQNEAQAISRMNHPNVVAIYNLGIHNDYLPFYVMDLLPGRSLLEILRVSGPVSLDEVLSIFSEVGAGLGYAHKKGIVHRDIKPANIILIDAAEPGSSRVRIVDFGIAKLSYVKDKANQGLTGVGVLCGSPYYMSPEQCQGERVDARSDIYSFGCTLFETLTGNPPFKGRNAIETMLMHQSQAPPTLKAASGREFPPMLERAMATMLAKAPMDRYQNMELIIADFNAILEGQDKAVSPYIGQGQSSQIVKENRTQEDFLDTPEENRARQRKTLLQAAGLIIAALTLVVVVVLVSGYLYHYATPKAQVPLSTHFDTLHDSPKTISAANQSRIPLNDSLSKFKPANANQAPGKALKVDQAYSHDTVRNGQTMRVFDFPADCQIGALGEVGQTKRTTARGHLEFKANAGLAFWPYPEAANEPQALKRFRPGDIQSVSLEICSGTKGVLAAVANIPGVKGLTIRTPDNLDDSCINDLCKMTSLTMINFDSACISGTALARLPFLQQLVLVAFKGGDNADALCQALAGSTTLKTLILEDSRISAPGFRAISTLTNLNLLTIDSSPVSDTDLSQMAKLPHLDWLCAINCRINPSQVPILKKFPALQRLQLYEAAKEPPEFLNIRQCLPKVKEVI